MNCRFYGFLLFQTLWNRQSCAKWAEACFNRLSCGQKISKTIKPSQAAKPFGQRTGMSFCSSNNQKYYDNLLLWGLYLCIISRCNINIYIHQKHTRMMYYICIYTYYFFNNVNIYIYICMSGTTGTYWIDLRGRTLFVRNRPTRQALALAMHLGRILIIPNKAGPMFLCFPVAGGFIVSWCWFNIKIRNDMVTWWIAVLTFSGVAIINPINYNYPFPIGL